MAGTFPGGGGDRFRDAISFVYDMAAPPALEDDGELVEQRAVFFLPAQLVYVDPPPSVDGRGIPFDPDKTVQRVRPPGIVVPCAVTYFDDQGEITRLGLATPTRIAVDLLDRDYTQVRDAEYVVVGGDRYFYRRTEPPSGLFDVGIYTVHFHADQET